MEHEFHEPDVECAACITKGYRSGLEASVEQMASTLDAIGGAENQVAKMYVLIDFSNEFFVVDKNGLPTK